MSQHLETLTSTFQDYVGRAVQITENALDQHITPDSKDPVYKEISAKASVKGAAFAYSNEDLSKKCGTHVLATLAKNGEDQYCISEIHAEIL